MSDNFRQFSMLSMKTYLAFPLLCFAIMSTPTVCSKWDELDQSLAERKGEVSAQDASEQAAIPEQPKPEPITVSGQYDLKAPKADNSFILWVPYDYNPDYLWPVIFCYHGAGGSVTTWPFQQVTRGQGFIIVGMNYNPLDSGRRTPEWVKKEKAFFFEALEMVSARLSVDPEMIFMGGYSQGGYHTTLLGEEVLDRLAGLIILGAGRFFIDHSPPPMRLIHSKPVFIGVGQEDTVHNPRAKKAARNYQLWGADVTFEEWPGVGHGIRTAEFPSKLLLDWLEEIFAEP